MTVEAVIFDIGNVLIEWQPERFYDRVIGRAARERMFADVDLHGMNDRIDRGAPWAETVAEWADRTPDHRDAVLMWHDNWIEMASPAIPRSVRLLSALRAAGVSVFALSNFGIQTFAYAETQYPFLGDFDKRYISGHMGIAKPDAEIYAAVEKDCGLAPGSLLFTDDRSENIEAAAARGWQTHLFADSAGLAGCLVALGLLTPEEAT